VTDAVRKRGVARGGMATEDEYCLSSRRTAEIIRRELARGDLNFAFRVITSAVEDFRDTSPETKKSANSPFSAQGRSGCLRTVSVPWNRDSAIVTARVS
jgi:hypothetical protein